MSILIQARAFLETSQPEKALDLLSNEINDIKNQSDVAFLSIFGETLLEVNQLEQAYQVLYKACELDQNADYGVEKFLYLGQIIGGNDGLNYINIALNKLNEKLDKYKQNGMIEDQDQFSNGEEYEQWIINKLNQGIFAEIEIWMTDLCMEDNAESKCNELIQISLNLDNTNPETYSLLSSIKISQQLKNEASEALNKSWELFQAKKQKLEEKNEDNKGDDSYEKSMEYIELIQPLLTLSKFAIELELYDLSISIISQIYDINDQILDCYYVEILSNLLKAKRIINGNNEGDFKEILNEEILKHKENAEVGNLIDEIKTSLTHAYKIINSGLSEDFDPEVIDTLNDLLNVFGGPIMSELMPKREKDDEDDENWEDEIDYEEN
ncbi:unnamed protein product [Candida verbasci]|uniref:Assembly chaperone of RPL4 n=1 Tax=Candida verbasci TaxID=1227364 RepID=A0A9W4TV05_9ASCO|nr:unnamed protein product [Candida verbasci]